MVVSGNAAAAELDVMMQEVQRRAQAAGDTREEVGGGCKLFGDRSAQGVSVKLLHAGGVCQFVALGGGGMCYDAESAAQGTGSRRIREDWVVGGGCLLGGAKGSVWGGVGWGGEARCYDAGGAAQGTGGWRYLGGGGW